MTCPNCGHNVREGAKFCDECGIVLPVMTPSGATARPAPSVGGFVSSRPVESGGAPVSPAPAADLGGAGGSLLPPGGSGGGRRIVAIVAGVVALLLCCACAACAVLFWYLTNQPPSFPL